MRLLLLSVCVGLVYVAAVSAAMTPKASLDALKEGSAAEPVRVPVDFGIAYFEGSAVRMAGSRLHHQKRCGLVVKLGRQIMRAQQCRAVSDVRRMLLILGGVEQNPGPPQLNAPEAEGQSDPMQLLSHAPQPMPAVRSSHLSYPQPTCKLHASSCTQRSQIEKQRVNDIQHGGRCETSALPAMPAECGPKAVSPLCVNDFSIVESVNKLVHPSIPKLESVVDPNNPSKKIVREAATLNLRCIVQYNEQDMTCTTLTEGQVRYLLWPLASAVSCLHQNWIAHRNIKPGNIRVDEKDNVYLTGFGSAVKCEDHSMTVDGNHAGDISFLSPEFFGQRQFSGAAQDMWALGVTLYMLLYGIHPFLAVRVSELEEYVCNKEPEFPNSLNVAENVKSLVSLIKELLMKDPKERLTLEELRKHPFLFEENFINGYNSDGTPFIFGYDLKGRLGVPL